MDWSSVLVGLAVGFAVALVTTPVGVSGAVFLLPVQLSVLHVPSPQITPTNLLFNVVAVPGALARYRRHAQMDRDLVGQLLSGAVPGMIAGALIRVQVAADPDVFRLLAAAVLGPIGLLALGVRPRGRLARPPTPRTVRLLALGVGVIGGLYGVGGGSLLAPLLVGAGLAVSRVGPAALACTWVTSLVGVATYGALALTSPGSVAPDWTLGLAAGVGGLLGGWCGATLQPRVPERVLRVLLGMLAVGLALLYVAQVVLQTG